MMRLFIAINFDQETKRNIIAVQQRLRQLGPGNFSPPENLHLTLVFLGEVAPERVAAVQSAMDLTAVRPMTLAFDHVGCFERDGSDIWWFGLEENNLLMSMRKDLSGHLSDAGFRLESRRFLPHMTLAREVRLTTPPDRGALLEKPFVTQANAISLMCSDRIGSRIAYTELYRKG
ncbi:MAG TPA: RNA 2',3'-cyclic phosphodiesterase [Clostridia bacterium]|nr:RNA 2',3'-cyclic phosphodiesterase [Clostridia bacterium]